MLSALSLFLKVAECGSFSAAASILDMSPSAVSRRILKLENELNIRLFKRTTRHLVLTDAGRTLLETIGPALADIRRACEAARRPPGEAIRGELRVSVFETFGRLHVCPLLPGFLDEHPAVRVELLLENGMVNLYRDEVDLAIRIGRPEDSGLKARKLAGNRFIACASPAYLERRGRPQTPDELARHNCLALSRGRQATYWYFRRDDDCTRVEARGNLISVGGTPLLEAAVQGAGITVLAEWMVKPELESGQLSPLLEQWQAELREGGSGDVYAVFAADPHMNPALRAFIDYMCEAIPRRLQRWGLRPASGVDGADRADVRALGARES